MTRRKSKLTLVTEGQVFDKARHRAVVIEYYPNQGDVLVFRAHGLRTRHSLPIANLYGMAARRTADLERMERRQKRGNKK